MNSSIPCALLFAAALMLRPSASDAAEEAPVLVLNSNRVHLGEAGLWEWDHFANDTPDARRLDIRFDAVTNRVEATLFIRQDDVKQDWPIELNNRRIGKLFLMEADLVHATALPPGSLRTGENLLSIVSPRERDDILLREIRIVKKPLTEAVHEANLEIRVSDLNGSDLPCRITIVNQRGTLMPIVAVTNAMEQASSRFIAVRPGVVYTGDGHARLGLPAGGYTVYASRGFEWSVATQQVQIAKGDPRQIALQLRREVPTPGLISCDTHVHTVTYSGHGDASLEERMLTLAGEGIELPIATDHNIQVNYSEPAQKLGMNRWFTPVAGNEVTTPAGHFNIFPVAPGARVPDFHLTNWPTLMQELRGTPDVRVVILNHPRNVHNGFQPFAGTNYNHVTGENKKGVEFSFDAVEVLNSSAQQSDYMLVYRDWFALLNYGYRITAVGSSDGHDVSRYIVGQGRTYIACADEDPGRIDVGTACSNLLAGRAYVSMGLLAQILVDGRFVAGDLATGLNKQVRIRVKVSGPSWVRATNVALFANGTKIREATPITMAWNSSNGEGEKAVIEWTIERPPHDVHLIAIATGPPVTAPFWAIPRPYQPTSQHWESRVIGSTNPVWIDGDGDGRFTSPRALARDLVSQFGKRPAELIRALGDFDEAVATQAASFFAAGDSAEGQRALANALAGAMPHVRRGFEAYDAAR
jgi:hypothetical protein